MTHAAFIATDVETTGVRMWGPNADKLLQVCMIAVDEDLNPVDDGINVIIKPFDIDGAYHLAVPFVQEMHTATGLWAQLEQGYTMPQAARVIGKYLDGHTNEETKGLPQYQRELKMLGSSVKMDYNFIEKFMPSVMQHLSYQVIDVSSIAILSRKWMGLPRFKKMSTHAPEDDINETLMELRWLREQGVFRL